MTKRMIGCVVAGAVALSLGLVACGGEESQASADQSLCSALATYASAVAGLQGLDLQSTKQDIQTQADAVQSAWGDVESAAQDVANANVNAIQSAQSNVQSAVDGLSDDTTVAQAAQDLQPQLQALAQAYNETFSGLDCASTLTSTSSSS